MNLTRITSEVFKIMSIIMMIRMTMTLRATSGKDDARPLLYSRRGRYFIICRIRILVVVTDAVRENQKMTENTSAVE